MVKRVQTSFYFIFLFYNLVFAVDATIDIVKTVDPTTAVAIEGFSHNSEYKDFAVKIKRMLETDLKVSAMFTVKKITPTARFESEFKIDDYRQLKVSFVIRYITVFKNNRHGINAKIFNVNTNKIIFQKEYTVKDIKRYPFLSHRLVNEFAQKNGYKGLSWMEKFVIFSLYDKPKKTFLIVSDYTLTFRQVILKNGFILFPKWQDATQKHFFYSDYSAKPTLYKMNLYTGERTALLKAEGMVVTSDVSTDGKKVLITDASKGNADLYLYDIEKKKKRQLTFYKGIDVNGNFVDQDKAFVFISNRLGRPNVFYQKLNSRDAIQFIHKISNNTSLTAFDNYVAYVSQETEREFSENTFNIYLASTQTNYLRKLTNFGINSFPRFSSVGDTILFLKQYYNESALGIIRLQQNKTFLFPLKGRKIQSIDW